MRFTNKPWVSLPDTKRYLVCLNETSETVTQRQSLSTREWGQAASSPLSLYCLSTMRWADHNTMYRRRCPVIILNTAACFHSFFEKWSRWADFLQRTSWSYSFTLDTIDVFQPWPCWKMSFVSVVPPWRVSWGAVHMQNGTQTLPLTLSHTHKANQFLCSSCWVCILFPEVLISCLASSPALPSSLCPHCPEQSGGQLTLPLDWRLCLLHINRCRSIYLALMKIFLQGTKAFLFLPAPSVALHGLETFKL